LNSIHQKSGNDLAIELRGFGPVGILAILVIGFSGSIVLPNMLVLPVGAILTLIWVHFSRTPWREIGYTKPKSWILTILFGLVIGVILKLFSKSIILPILHADPANHHYQFLVGNTAILPTAIISMLTVGFAEETVFRGFLFERLGKLIGNRPASKGLIIVITSVLFAMGHLYDQGVWGAEQAAITGIVYGIIYSITRNIWMAMIAHAIFDLVSLAIIYWDVETKVAHWFF
jgi:CAAX protease family protein